MLTTGVNQPELLTGIDLLTRSIGCAVEGQRRNLLLDHTFHLSGIREYRIPSLVAEEDGQDVAKWAR